MQARMRLTTRAQAVPCPRCAATTITGLTDPPAAWTATTDPIPLGPAEELHALIDGRLTYDLITTGPHHQLIYRSPTRITHHAYPVLATHKCPGPVPWTENPPPPGENIDNDIPF